MPNPLDHLRKICLALPEVTEKISHGEPAWFVRKRLFLMFADEHHDNRVAFWCAAPEGVQEAMVASEPDKYFRPPYVGVKGWVGVYLDVPVDWSEIREIVADAHQTIVAKLESSKKPRAK